MPHISRWAAALLIVLLAGSAVAAPRPISEAERAAVQIAVDYLNRGPQAVAEQLAAASPLRRLPPPTQLEEIEVRLGPPAGAVWELQTVVPSVADRMAMFAVEFPSGVDDAAIFDLTKEGNAYKIVNVHTLGEKSAKKAAFPPPPPEPVKTADAAASGFSPAAIIIMLAVLAAALGGAGAFTQEGLSRILIAAALVIAIAAVSMAVLKDPRFGFVAKKVEAAKAPEKHDDGRLGALLPLRRAIAAGGAEADALFAKASARNDVANVWRAQWELQQTRTDNAKKSLAAFPSPSDIPLVEIVRARLALINGDDTNAVLAYERAINLGPGRDGLWMETAQTLMALGFDDRGTEYLKRSEEIGSRSADLYYIQAMLLASKNKQQDAEAKLKTAWAMRPVERARLVEAAVLWSVLRSNTMTQTVSLATPTEASFAAPELGSRPIAFPANAWPTISGGFLHLQIGEQEMDVPGGAALAPPFALAVDAAAWQHDEDARAIKQVPQLLASANAGAYASPALRRRMVRAARALAAHNRWNDLLALTNGVTPASEHMPSELFFLRSLALEHTEHPVEAKQVMVSLAASRVLQRKNDAQALADLGNRLASFDEYDAAMKLLERAQNIRAKGSLDDRLRQLEMNKRLASAFATYKTQHFEIHYPQEAGTRFAEAMGGVLEKEFVRLQAWVPVPDFKPLIINVLEWRDFRSTYTGSDFILGFYEGKITLPFAGVDRFSPLVVSILSHELLHAMLAQATHGQAPHWFQEGLAQRIEMKPYSSNAFNMYTDDKLLALSLLDAVLRGSPDPEMIEQAYIESQTTIRYVEARYGASGVTKLIAAFRDGATTEDAIQQLSGGSVAKFDSDMRTWGRSASHVFENPPIIDYAPEDTGIHFSTRRDS